MAQRGGFRTQAPREITWGVAAILWLLGIADLVLHLITLPANYGVYALALSALLLLLATVIAGL